MTTPYRLVISAALIAACALAALPAAAEVPEQPKLKTTLEPLDKSLSQLLDEGYQILDFQFEDNEAAFGIMKAGHNALCMINKDGMSQCIGLN